MSLIIGSTRDTHCANKATTIHDMGRPVASYVGPEATRAGSKARAGPTYSHLEFLQSEIIKIAR